MDLIAEVGGRRVEVTLERRSDTEVTVTIDGRTYEVDALTNTQPWSLLLGGAQNEVAVSRDGRGHVQVSSRTRRTTLEVFDPLEYLVREATGGAAGQGAQRVEALMPGRVVKHLKAVGDAVEVGDGVVVVEAMKMENEIAAETSGVVAELAADEGQAVEAGDLLFVIEAADEAE